MNRKESSAGNKRKRLEHCDFGDESGRSAATSSCTNACVRQQNDGVACRSDVQFHPFSAGRRPLLLPPVRWPMPVATKQKHLRRPFTAKTYNPNMTNSLVLLALLCLSYLLNNPADIKQLISRQKTQKFDIGNDLNNKKHYAHHIGVINADKFVTQRMHNLHHSLLNLNPDFAPNGQFVNILLTGQQRSSPSRPGTPSSSPAPTLVAASPSMPFPTQQQADDPTLMDYDAIDAFWRLDIEQEKSGALHEHFHYEQQAFNAHHQQQQGQNQPSPIVEPTTTTWNHHHRQYERDLQLLTEKSLFSVPLQTVETAATHSSVDQTQPMRFNDATNCEDDDDHCDFSPKLCPTNTNQIDTTDHDGDEWLRNILLEQDETDVTASGWTERWWKTVDDFAAVSAAVEHEEEGQEQTQPNHQFRQFGQSQFAHIQSKNEPSEHFGTAHDNLLDFDCSSSSIFSNFDSSPFCSQFEGNDFLDYEEEEEAKTDGANSATEAILRDMTTTIPLIQNLNFSSNSEWQKMPKDMENLPCSSHSCAGDFETSESSSNDDKFTPPHDYHQGCSSSLRCSSTSSGFGSFIGDLDDLALSPANSTCTLLAYDEFKSATADSPSSSSIDDRTNFVDDKTSMAAKEKKTVSTMPTGASVIASHSYRMEKLMPMPTPEKATPAMTKRRRKMMPNGQRRQKRNHNLMAKINKKGDKSSKFDELKRRQDEEEELIAISSIAADSRFTTTLSQQQQLDKTKVKGKRGRKSKDNSLVNEHDLPYSAEWLTAMPYSMYSELMNDFRLTTQQKALIKKIRRRGRNKLAAQKCRERRVQKQEWEHEECPIAADEDEILFLKEEDDELVEFESVNAQPTATGQLVNPADLSLYPTSSSHIGAEHHRHQQDYSEFVHSTIIARRRAVRVHV